MLPSHIVPLSDYTSLTIVDCLTHPDGKVWFVSDFQLSHNRFGVLGPVWYKKSGEDSCDIFLSRGFRGTPAIRAGLERYAEALTDYRGPDGAYSTLLLSTHFSRGNVVGRAVDASTLWKELIYNGVSHAVGAAMACIYTVPHDGGLTEKMMERCAPRNKEEFTEEDMHHITHIFGIWEDVVNNPGDSEALERLREVC